MIKTFDKHFKPALREMSRGALIGFIHGTDQMPALDRRRFKEEIIAFLAKITQSGEPVLNPSAPEEPSNSRIEE